MPIQTLLERYFYCGRSGTKKPKTKSLYAHKLTYINTPISPKEVKGYSNTKTVSGQFRNKTNSYITHNLNIFPHYSPTSKSVLLILLQFYRESNKDPGKSYFSAAILCELYNLHSNSVSGKNCKCKLGKTWLKKKQHVKIKVSLVLQSTHQ